MSNINPITVGRIVHFFPNGSDREDARLAAQNNAELVPGIVTQVLVGLTVNMQVFTNGSQPVIQAFSIDHKSEAVPGAPYWDYPVIVEAKPKAPALAPEEKQATAAPVKDTTKTETQDAEASKKAPAKKVAAKKTATK